jgi:uncharacterized membrane protein
MDNRDGLGPGTEIPQCRYTSEMVGYRWGIVASLAGVLIAILVASGGVVIVALWLIMTLQGAIVQYVFRQ